MNRKIVSMLNLALAIVVCAFSASLATAQVRTWVSGVGDDANPCSRTAPCKTFFKAHSVTASGGEISVLDPGGYGAVTITKAITISGEGTLAGISHSGTNGIIVNAGASDVVIIRNILINGNGTGINGIRYLAGKQLIVENTNIAGVTSNGIDVALSAAGNLSVRNTAIKDCDGAGINIAASGTPTASLDNVQMHSCGSGLAVATGNATISRSIISQNTNQALLASAATAIINAEGCTLTDNGTGVDASVSGATIRISNCAITGNNTGIAIAAGGTVVSFGNNKNTGNTTNGAPNLLLAQQ
ncbi:MAG: right-handed parallel beta-helix repeat-containing protein [Acidobacteriota bacterium]